MLPVRRSLPPVRLRARRRHHHRPRRTPALDLAAGLIRRRRRAHVAAALAFGVVVATVILGMASAASAGPRPFGKPAPLPSPPVTYVPPVDAPIADPFRPPAGPYGAGNRGLEYTTTPGTPVRASADGTVGFAGQVGGALHVTLLHADGVRTSYSFLAAVDVLLGQQVRQGDHIGRSAERLHFGARVGDAYFDPAALFTGTVTDVELLPFE
ncbi:MAG: murein hydrolase activator EnvC family protein, partial [Acidimicrobiales bacterium]